MNSSEANPGATRAGLLRSSAVPASVLVVLLTAGFTLADPNSDRSPARSPQDGAATVGEVASDAATPVHSDKQNTAAPDTTTAGRTATDKTVTDTTATGIPAIDQQQAIQALQPLAGLVGSWRGVGQPQRGSSRGAWTEDTTTSWNFQNQSAALVLDSHKGRLFDVIRFEVNPEGTPSAKLTLPDGAVVSCLRDAENSDQTKQVFVSTADQWPQYRCSIRQLNDIRATVLLETRSTATGGFRRVAEVGYTRAGERLARSGAGEKQCIVTGGLGTISVSFEGKTYYVCCEGCQQAFDADPAGTVADYRKRQAALKQ